MSRKPPPTPLPLELPPLLFQSTTKSTEIKSSPHKPQPDLASASPDLHADSSSSTGKRVLEKLWPSQQVRDAKGSGAQEPAPWEANQGPIPTLLVWDSTSTANTRHAAAAIAAHQGGVVALSSLNPDAPPFVGSLASASSGRS